MAHQILVDTSAWIEALRPDGDDATRREVRLALEEGAAVFCDLVRLELWNGARGDRERAYLKALERESECLSTTGEVWERSRDLARKCRSVGLTIPATVLLIAACALHYGTEILHRDRYFDKLLELVGS